MVVIIVVCLRLSFHTAGLLIFHKGRRRSELKLVWRCSLTKIEFVDLCTWWWWWWSHLLQSMNRLFGHLRRFQHLHSNFISPPYISLKKHSSCQENNFFYFNIWKLWFVLISWIISIHFSNKTDLKWTKRTELSGWTKNPFLKN